MKNIDVTNTMTYIKRSMKENESYFDEDVINQFEKADVIGKQYLEKLKEITSTNAESSKIVQEREIIIVKIYQLSSEIATELRVFGKNEKKDLYFGENIPSKIRKSFNKGYDFLKNCQYLLTVKGDKSEIIKFKSKVNELYIETNKHNDLFISNSSLKINIHQDKDDLYSQWYKELYILKLKIEIKSIIHGFNYKNIYKEISLSKTKKKTIESKKEK